MTENEHRGKKGKRATLTHNEITGQFNSPLKAVKRPVTRIRYADDYIAIHEHSGYTYLHLSRASGRVVAVLPFRIIDGDRTFLARREICPAHADEHGLYSITEGVEGEESLMQAAIRGLIEEAGMAATADQVIELGEVYQSKYEDTIVGLFAIDATTITQGPAHSDGTIWEDSATSEWVPLETALQIKDVLFSAMLARLLIKAN